MHARARLGLGLKLRCFDVARVCEFKCGDGSIPAGGIYHVALYFLTISFIFAMLDPFSFFNFSQL